MTHSLDILLIENEPEAGLHSASVLDAGGHRVHRCYPRGRQATAASSDGTAICVAVTDGACPIEREAIDVAVVAGRQSEDRPGLTAAGVTCALRNHIPLVADDSCTGTFGARLSGRANGDVVAACVRALEDAHADLRADILTRIAPTIAAEHLDMSRIGCRVTADGHRLTVTVTGPPTSRSVQQALGVRVLDAVRSAGRTFGQVDVGYDTVD
jgi:hypothetical protein